MQRILLVLALLLVGLALGHFDIDDSVLFKVEFPGSHKEPTDLGSGGGNDLFSEEMETYTMVARNKEKYECRIPKVSPVDLSKESDYTGPSPLGLMEQLFAQKSCTFRLEAYWTYELCHGRFLRQYHEERVGKELKMQEFFLGKFSQERVEEMLREEEKDKENEITRHPPTKRIESMNMPYFELTMEDGTKCDLNNQPRRTRVLYICYPTGRNEIYQLKETSSCEYEVIVLSAVLCSHPSFKPAEVSEHAVACKPVSQASTAKPQDLLRLEAESASLRSQRMWEAFLKDGDKAGQVRIQIRPAGARVEEEEAMENDSTTRRKAAVWKESNREPFKPLMDPQVVKEFLRGEYCLYGGSGWWKYEFCYGNKVDQYHQENNGEKTVINLGNFNMEKHVQWLKNHPKKRPKPVESRKHFSHFYSDGDVCDLTGAPRHIEVKMKCKKADSPSAVTLYLLEPLSCQYILVVESPLICDILPHIDGETGFMPPGLIDNLDETIEPEHIKHSSSSKSVKTTTKIVKTGGGEVKTESSSTMETSVDQVTASESTSRLVSEKVVLNDGVRVTYKETVLNGVVVASEVTEERVDQSETEDKEVRTQEKDEL